MTPHLLSVIMGFRSCSPTREGSISSTFQLETREIVLLPCSVAVYVLRFFENLALIRADVDDADVTVRAAVQHGGNQDR